MPEWCLPAYSFCLFFFLNWYLPSMKSFFHVWIRKPIWISSPPHLLYHHVDQQPSKDPKENCITFFPEESIGWFTWMSPACSGCTVYFTIQAKELHMWMLLLGSTSRCFLCLAAWLLQMQSVCGQVQNNISLVLWKDVTRCIKKYFLNYKLFKMFNLAKKRYFALGLKICLGCLNVASLNLILICWNLFLRGSGVEKCWHN